MTALLACGGVEVVHRAGEASVRALGGVDAEVRTGDRVALLGRSGSGKSTLLHVLGGLLEPSAGRVEREDDVVIAHVFQSANLLPHFTAEENVAFAAERAVRPSAYTGAELLALVGLAGKETSLPADLSGGEAQRVAIARALAQGPDVLLCDEPTGHLDSDTGGRVLDLLDALQAEVGFALVIATHDPDVAARLERTIELHDGRVVATPELTA